MHGAIAEYARAESNAGSCCREDTEKIKKSKNIPVIPAYAGMMVVFPVLVFSVSSVAGFLCASIRVIVMRNSFLMIVAVWLPGCRLWH